MKKVFFIFLSLFISLFAYAKSIGPMALSCFEEAMFTDTFANPLNVTIFISNAEKSSFFSKIGIYDPERNRLTPLTSSYLSVQKVENSSGSYSLVYGQGKKALTLTIDESEVPVLKSTGKILDKNYYWAAKLKSSSLEPIPAHVDLICRHDGLWF